MARRCRSLAVLPCAHSAGVFRRVFHVALVAMLLFNVSFAFRRVPQDLMIPLQPPRTPSVVRRAVPLPAIMDVFQVSPPVTVPANVSSQCNQTLMIYSFGNSYGKPFVGQYSPPACEFNRVIMNFTATSAGRQFDRLAIMYLSDVEIWRTSTAEPTTAGILFTYEKDVSNYLVLWKQPQKIIFDLGNIVNDIYTGPFNTTLAVTFFSAPTRDTPADVIVPLSAKRSATNQSSAWNVPETKAVDAITIPRNAKKAIFSLSAVGQMEEEFWWSNTLSSDTKAFVNNTLLGFSPFREVQLLIDGNLAGAAWPFPVIFTGGVVPGFWRPIVGIDTYDLKEDEIDITPWLSVLSDGKPHTYEIQVMGLSDDGKGNAALTTVGAYWVVTGKMFLWLDNADSTTSGGVMTKLLPRPNFFLTSKRIKSSNGTNLTLNYQVLAQRQISIASTIVTSEGAQLASWTQTLSYSNIGLFGGNGNNQTNDQMTSGVDVSSSGYSRKFGYPLWVYSTVDVDPASKNMTIAGKMDRGKNVQVIGSSAFPSGLESYTSEGQYNGAITTTRQNGTATYISIPARNRSISWGGTEQDYVFSGLLAGQAVSAPQVPMVDGSTPLFSRHVLAVNGTVAKDDTNVGRTFVIDQEPSEEDPILQEFAIMQPEDMVGAYPVPRSAWVAKN